MKKQFLFAIFCTGFLHAQPGVKEFSNCGQLQAVMIFANDMALFKCDTSYVLNKLTFRKYDSAYRDLQQKGSSVGNLMNAYDEIIELQENRLKEQAQQYNELRASFAGLSTETQAKIVESSSRLTSAVSSMESLSKDLTETKRLLGEAKDIIEAEQRGLNLEKLLWGAGGLAAGIVVGVLIAK